MVYGTLTKATCKLCFIMDQSDWKLKLEKDLVTASNAEF